MSPLRVLFDFRSPAAYLALRPTIALTKELGVDAQWLPLLVAPPREISQPGQDASRGELHRWHRARYRVADLQRYARAQQLPDGVFAPARLYREQQGLLAAAAYLWLVQAQPAAALDFMQQLFDGYWQGTINLDSQTDLQALMDRVTHSELSFDNATAATALAELTAHQAALEAQGYFEVPGYLIDNATYYGREHLPMLRWHLEHPGATQPDHPHQTTS